MERIILKAKDRPVNLNLHNELDQPKALLEIGNTIPKSVTEQEITPGEAKSLMSVLTVHRDTTLMEKLREEINELKLLSQNKGIC